MANQIINTQINPPIANLPIVGNTPMNPYWFRWLSTMFTTISEGNLNVLNVDTITTNNVVVTGSISGNIVATAVADGEANDLLIQKGMNSTGFLRAGHNNQLLTIVNGSPIWANPLPPILPPLVDSINTLTGNLTLSSPSNTINVTNTGSDLYLDANISALSVVQTLNNLVGNVSLISSNSTVTITTVGNNLNLEANVYIPPAPVYNLWTNPILAASFRI